MKKRKVRNLLALAVLCYLIQRPMHPYELGRTLREHGDDRSIKFNHGSLYMVIGQLAKAGYITEHEVEREGQRPERTVYALTDAGRDELRDWLRELLGEPAHEYPSFVAGLSFLAALPPAEAIELLRSRIDGLDAQRAEIQRQLDHTGEVHPLFLVEEDYRLKLLEAEVEFIQELIARITDPENGWEEMWNSFHASPDRQEE